MKNNCTKPNCDCIAKAEEKAGGPVKSYPCLADNSALAAEALKSVYNPGMTHGSQLNPAKTPPKKLNHSIEPHWIEELAELRSRPETDPYQIAIGKIYNMLEGIADDELKGLLCGAIWKQAIEPLAQAVSLPSGAAPQADPVCQLCGGEGFIEVDTRQPDGSYKMTCGFCEARNDAMEERDAHAADANLSSPTLVEALKYAKETIDWMFNNMSVDDKRYLQDAHDRPANACHAIDLALETMPAPPAAGPVADGKAVKALEHLVKICKGQMDKKFFGCAMSDAEAALENYYKRDMVQAAQVDYKVAIRQMMKETNSDLITHAPQLGGTQRAKVQVIVMDEFFKTFPPGTDLEQLRQQYNSIKPSV